MTPLARRLLASVALALVVGACGGGAATPSAAPTDGLASLTPAPPETAAPASSEPNEPPSEAPTDPPSEAPASDEPSDSPDPAAAACSGSDANRDFFASVAGSVEWAVYCPVLPSGWFVESGQYRLAGGSWLEIAYQGPGGTRIELRQGAPCPPDGCIPTGTDLGAADYGDLAGTMLDLGGGQFAVVVDPGANPSWTIVGTALAEDDVRHIAADLALVGG